MLLDFLKIEHLFGQEEAALYTDDALRRYGKEVVSQALTKKHIICKIIYFGPDSGRSLCWLSPKGRLIALDELY